MRCLKHQQQIMWNLFRENLADNIGDISIKLIKLKFYA